MNFKKENSQQYFLNLAYGLLTRKCFPFKFNLIIVI